MNGPDEYQNYKKWKDWGRPKARDPWIDNYYQKEISLLKINKLQSVLEIGFGNGEFLDWAYERQLSVLGLDIIPELVESAQHRHEVYCWDINSSKNEANPVSGRKFDCIVAFDVIEHFTGDQIVSCLTRFNNILDDDGKVLLRFPNGESPFSLPLQNGDCTHKTFLNRRKLEFFCIGTGLQVESYRNAARVAHKPLLSWFQYLVFFLRDMMEVFFGYLYHSQRIPLDPASVAVLSKSQR